MGAIYWAQIACLKDMDCETFQKLVVRNLQGSQVAVYQYMSKAILDRKPYFSQILS